MPPLDERVTTLPTALESTWRDARQALQAGDRPAAIEHLRRIRRDAPRFVRAHLLYQDVLVDSGRADQIASEYRPPPIRDGVSLLLFARVARGRAGGDDRLDSRGRIQLLEEAIEIEPGLAWAHYALGFEFERIQEFDRALESLKQAVRIDPQLPEAHVALADLYYRTGEPRRAIEHYGAYLDRCPRDAPRWFRLAFLYQGQGRIEAAESCYRKVLGTDLPVVRAAIRTGSIALRESQLDRLEQRAPVWYSARVNLSELLIEAGRDREAVDVLQPALRDWPERPDAHYNLGIAYERLGNLERAHAHWENYLALGGTQRTRVASWIEEVTARRLAPAR